MATDFPGHPQEVYEWRHFTQPGDTDAPADTYALPIAFIGGITSYTLTWADRPEVIDEMEVRGLFGFTIDTSKLAALVR